MIKAENKRQHIPNIKLIIVLILLLSPISLLGNTVPGNQEIAGGKRIQATRTSIPPRIDGILEEQEWFATPVAGDFIIYIPDNGQPSNFRTEVHVLYDNVALYVGAYMYDENPDSIYLELGQRDADRMLNADNFSIEISPYNDGVNGFRFKVSASGVQSDSRIELRQRGGSGGGGSGGGGGIPGLGGSGGRGSSGPQDNWDAVWESKVSLK